MNCKAPTYFTVIRHSRTFRCSVRFMVNFIALPTGGLGPNEDGCVRD
jgi:hypothetical protein